MPRRHRRYPCAFRLIALVGAFLCLPAVAWAQCLDREEAVRRLAADHGETVIGIGAHSKGLSVVEVYVGRKGSWTVLITYTNGRSCVAASGIDWQGEAPCFGEGL